MAKILIVEDDKFIANAYRVKFTHAGFETKIAEDGEVAIEALKTFTPDIILLDLILPRKDGFAVLEELKANKDWKSIPVIIASNLGQKEDIDKGLKLGANDYIIKTDLSMSDLINKVAPYLKK